MTSDPPDGPTESGLPNKRGEFSISLPWIARIAMTVVIGAAVGFVASAILAPRLIGQGGGWIMMAACAGAATLLSIRKVHAWHLSTFADGTLVGLVAWPLSVFLTAAFLWRNVGFGWHALLYGFIGLLITVPCGWLAGFAYHLSLTAAERARSGNDEDMVS